MLYLVGLVGMMSDYTLVAVEGTWEDTQLWCVVGLVFVLLLVVVLLLVDLGVPWESVRNDKADLVATRR